MNITKLLLYVICSLAIFALMNGFFMFFYQEKMIFYPQALPRDFKFDFPGRFEEVNIPVDGAEINALHFKAANSKGVVLYFHGNAGNLSGWGDVAPDFTRHGFDIVIPDYRGFGKSTGKIESEKMLLADAQQIYDFVRKTYPEERILIYGRSIGTGLAVYLAKTNRPRLIMLESPYSSLLDLVSHHYPLVPRFLLGMLLKYPLRSDIWIAEVACPVYLFHGDRDDIIPYSQSELLAGHIRSKHELIMIAGGAHNNLNDYKQYHNELGRILGY